MSATQILVVYLSGVFASAVLALPHITAILDAEGEDEHHPYGYLLMWAVMAFTLTGILVSLVYHTSKIKRNDV